MHCDALWDSVYFFTGKRKRMEENFLPYVNPEVPKENQNL